MKSVRKKTKQEELARKIRVEAEQEYEKIEEEIEKEMPFLKGKS